MLIGAYPMSVDAKARVTLPSAFRRQMDKTIVLVPFAGHVNGFTQQDFTTWLNGLFDHGEERFNPRDRRDAKLKSGILGAALEVDLDSAGRLALGKLDASKPGSRERLGLTADVGGVGQEDHFEVWNAQKWNAEQESFEEDIDSLLYGDEGAR